MPIHVDARAMEEAERQHAVTISIIVTINDASIKLAHLKERTDHALR